MLRVVVIDDQEQSAEVVRATMGGEPDFASIGHATNVADGPDLIETFEPDLVAVNVQPGPGPGDGIASIAQITERHPNVGNKPDWSHTTTLEATPANASRARAFVTHHLVDHRLLYLVDPVRLVASELATNALLHAQTAFSVTLAASDTSVLLTVRDHSPALPEPRASHALDETGRGLKIVDAFSLEWGLNEDGAGSKAIWASFAIRGRREF